MYRDEISLVCGGGPTLAPIAAFSVRNTDANWAPRMINEADRTRNGKTAPNTA